MIKRLNGSIPSRNANTATAAAAILFLPGAENEKRLQTVHIMVEQEENIPRTRTTEKTAPSTLEICLARYRVGIARDAASFEWSRMAVFMMAMASIIVKAPHTAPHLASFLLRAVIPRAVN